MTSTLKISPELALPLEAVTEAFAILAVSGAGKSNAGVVFAEELYDNNLPWVAIDPKGDWWGVRAAGDGKAPGLSVVVFGGEHADVPLEPSAGRYIAELIAEQRLTCVLDISEMTKADMRRFLTDFAERLYRRNREPLMVICEEADEYIPQQVRGESAKVVGAMETLVKKGRFRGIGTCLITQRSASLNKDVLSQARNLIAMQTPSPQDRKAILGWIDHHSSARDIVDRLPQLQPGEAWFFSPAWMRTLVEIRFRRRRTFDSGATPKIGEKRQPPARLADVDLVAIKEAMAETIERAKADDPRELRKRIAELERHRCPEPTAVEPERVEVPIWTDADREFLTSAVVDLRHLREELGQGLTRAESMMTIARDLAATMPGATPSQTPVTGRPSGRPQPTQSAPRARTAVAPERPAATSTRERRPAGDGSLGKGEKVILTAVAQYPDGVTREQLTVLTGYKRSSRDTYLQRLRTNGLVDVRGAQLVATQTAFDVLGDDFEPLPTGAALRQHWLTTLSGGEQAILAALINAYPAAVHRDDLSEATGYKRSSRDTYLQRLRARQLVTTDGDPRAADLLFESA